MHPKGSLADCTKVHFCRLSRERTIPGMIVVIRRIAAIFAALASVLAFAGPFGPDGERGRTHPGKFIWYDLATENVEAAKSFYGKVLGWTFRPVPGAPASYTLIESGGTKVGGVFRQARPAGAKVGSRWLALVSVRDPAAAAQYVRDKGGQVLLAPVNVRGRGTHAVFRDPQGAVFGVLAAGDGDPADTPVADGDVFWVDLFTNVPLDAASFYTGLAGYEVFPGGASWGRDRWILATEGIARAGLVPVAAGKMAPGWLPYILVDDVAGTLQRAQNAGGKIIVAPRADLLGGNLAVIADPLGGVVGIVDWAARTAAPR